MIFQTVTELMYAQHKYTQKQPKRTNKRDLTQKRRKGEQPLLYATHRWDFIHIAMKFHEDIPNSYLVLARTRPVGQKTIKGA